MFLKSVAPHIPWPLEGQVAVSPSSTPVMTTPLQVISWVILCQVQQKFPKMLLKVHLPDVSGLVSLSFPLLFWNDERQRS